MNNGKTVNHDLWSALKEVFGRLLNDPLGRTGLVLVALMVLSAVFASTLAPYNCNQIAPMDRLLGPSADHLIGTDQLGRDNLSRVLMGGRIALKVSLTAVGISLAAGLFLGLIAGYGPSWLDNILLIIFDSIRSFPTIMFALAVVALTGPSLTTIINVVIITSIPVYARVTRTQTQSLKNADFILAEKSMGASFFRILGIHILPNIIGPLLIIASMDLPVVITIESGLSFLGLGVRPPTPSWGSILNDGYNYIRNTPWMLIAGGVPLVLTTLGFTFLGESLRDIFDPKLKKDY